MIFCYYMNSQEIFLISSDMNKCFLKPSQWTDQLNLQDLKGIYMYHFYVLIILQFLRGIFILFYNIAVTMNIGNMDLSFLFLCEIYVCKFCFLIDPNKAALIVVGSIESTSVPNQRTSAESGKINWNSCSSHKCRDNRMLSWES